MRRLILIPALGLAAGLALAVTPAASAGTHTGPTGRSVHALTAPNVYSNYQAGYTAHGGSWRFAKVAACFQVPLTNTINGPAGGFRVFTQLASGVNHADVGITATAADTYQAAYQLDGTATTMTLTPVIQPGDNLCVSIFRDVHGDGLFDFAVSDLTTGGAVAIPDVAFPAMSASTYASLLAHPNAPAGCGGVNPIGTDCVNSRLVLFTNTQFTAYNGHLGTLAGGPWPVAAAVETDSGFADGDLYASPGIIWANGANGATWMRP